MKGGGFGVVGDSASFMGAESGESASLSTPANRPMGAVSTLCSLSMEPPSVIAWHASKKYIRTRPR